MKKKVHYLNSTKKNVLPQGVGKTSVSRRAAFETSIRQMIATFCVNVRGSFKLSTGEGTVLPPGAVTPQVTLHSLLKQSLLVDIIPHSVQLSSLGYSSLPSPLYFHFHRPPSYVVLLSSHRMPIQLQPRFLEKFCDFPHFRCLPNFHSLPCPAS